MYKFIFLVFLLLMAFPLSSSAVEEATPVTQPPETFPETAPNSAEKDHGEILFFPENPERPSDDRFKVKAEEEVTLCLKLKGEGIPLLEGLKKQATGFRVILEDNEDPPNEIVITEGDGSERLERDPNGCYLTKFKIPREVHQGVYQVADLLFLTNTKNYYSIRENLYHFSKADELDVENPYEDTRFPRLVEIKTYQTRLRKIAKHQKFLTIKVHHILTFKEEGSGIDPDSLKVFYKFEEDGQSVGHFQSNCHPTAGEKNRFYCSLEVIRPEGSWELRHLSLELESIYLRDKAGNLLTLSDPDFFRQKAIGPIKFEFVDVVKGIKRGLTHQNIHRNKMRQK